MADISNLSAMLNPKDRSTLEDSPTPTWIPKDPRDLITPYIEPKASQNRSSLEFRRKKARDVYDGYGKIIEKCKELEDEIAEQSKNVTVSLKPEKDLRMIESVKRVFGTDGRTITFGMYQACIKALADISASNIPSPGV